MRSEENIDNKVNDDHEEHYLDCDIAFGNFPHIESYGGDHVLIELARLWEHTMNRKSYSSWGGSLIPSMQ